MRVGIDLSVLRQRRTGIGNYAFHLSESFKNLNTEHKLILLPGPKGTIPFWSKHIGYARDIRRQGIDVLHGPANVLPLFYKGPSVITLHDLAIYKHPEWFPSGQWLATKVVVPASIKKASKIIVPSLATLRRRLAGRRRSYRKMSRELKSCSTMFVASEAKAMRYVCAVLPSPGLHAGIGGPSRACPG